MESTIEQLPLDVEGYYSKKLLEAKTKKLFQKQIFYLEKLSGLYLEKNNWTFAAKLLNSALSIADKHLVDPFFHRYLISRIESIEDLFLESKGLRVAPHKNGITLGLRSWLKQVRKSCTEQLWEKHEPIEKVLFSLTDSYKNILSALVLDSHRLLSGPPTKWACVGMGSMARDEMCPYSDLEFAFLVLEKTEASLCYFRTLAQLVELKIISFGETHFPIFGHLFEEASAKASPTPTGFSLDSGGNTPLGKPGLYELIDTPEELARFQSVKWMQDDIIVTNALSSVCYIAGDEELVSAYNQAKEIRHKITNGLFYFTGTPLRETLALKLLAGNLQEFKPDLSKSKQETSAFGIKKELYRPFQSVLGSLTLFCGLPACSTFEMIKQLLQKGLLCPEGAKNLTQALSQLLNLRFEAHSFYQSEGEFLLHIEQGQPQDSQYLYLDEKRLVCLREIYKVLIPFHSCAEQFLRSQDPMRFAKSAFYDKSFKTQAAEFEKKFQYGNAHEARQYNVSLDPNNIKAQSDLGMIEHQMAEYKEALKRHFKGLDLAQQRYGENHPDVAAQYNNIGEAYHHLGDYDKAIEFLQKSLKIQLQVLCENHPDVATSHNNIGNVYDSLGDHDKALEFHQKALKIRLLAFDKNHPDVARSYSNVGSVYSSLGKWTQALEFYQKALGIRLLAFDENHPDIATSYNNIGLVYNNLGVYDQALKFLHKALESMSKILGENHPNVATCYNNIGEVYFNLGDWTQAQEFYQKALKINLQIPVENHPNVASSYNNIGNVFYKIGKLTQAQESYQKALEINLKIFGENHSDTAKSYSGIGSVYVNIGEYKKALEFHQKALKIQLQTSGEHHPHVATSYSSIGIVYQHSCKYPIAIECFSKALKIRRLAFGKKHPETAMSYNNLGEVYIHIGRYDLRSYYVALAFLQKALKINLPILGESHPDVADSYNNLGAAYKNLGEYDQALAFHQKALKIRLPAFGENHPFVATSYNNLGCTYYHLGKYDQALEFFQKALTVWLMTSHPHVPGVLGSLIACVGKASPSQIKTLQETCILCRKILGDQDPLVRQLMQHFPQ